jgi:hypothetical protein
VQEDASLVVLPEKTDGTLENIRGISARGLRLELLPECDAVLEVGLHFDLRELLLEEPDGLTDPLLPLLGTPP